MVAPAFEITLWLHSKEGQKWSRPVDEVLTDYAATSSSCSLSSLDHHPLLEASHRPRTNATRCGALIARHRVWADSINL